MRGGELKRATATMTTTTRTTAATTGLVNIVFGRTTKEEDGSAQQLEEAQPSMVANRKTTQLLLAITPGQTDGFRVDRMGWPGRTQDCGVVDLHARS